MQRELLDLFAKSAGDYLDGWFESAPIKAAYGFDGARGKYVDLLEAGIIDPTKVVRVALENAISIASVLLLTEATMTESPEPAPKTEASAELERRARPGADDVPSEQGTLI